MTWDELENEISALSAQIHYSPDMIIGIVRGGIIPARLLSHSLLIKDMYCVTVRKTGQERKISSEITEDLRDRNILLVEDVLETGGSLIAVKEYLKNKGALVKTASLYVMSHSKAKPDYFLKEIKEVPKFPWE